MKSSTDKEALLLLTHLIEFVYRLLWGDLFTLPVGGGIGISLMVVLLFTAGIWFTLRTRLLPVRLFRDMIAAVCEKNQNKEGLSSFQTLVVSTASPFKFCDSVLGALGVTDLARLTGVPQSSTYVTLSKLEEAGLIEKTAGQKRILTDLGFHVANSL